MHNTRRVKSFIGGMTLAAAIVVGYAVFVSHAQHLYFALALLGLAAVTSRMKVKLPRIDGNMSVNLPFLLIAVANLSAAEAILITCVSTAVQCWPQKPARFKPQQMTFNVSMMAFATCLAILIFHAGVAKWEAFNLCRFGADAGNSDFVRRTDRPGGCDHRSE